MIEPRTSKWQHCPCGYACFSHSVVTHCPQCNGVLRPGQRPVITVVDGQLVCPHCGGNDFTMVESGYSRFDSVRLDEFGKTLVLRFFEMSDDGDGSMRLFCDNPKCTGDRELGFAIPEGLEIDYE